MNVETVSPLLVPFVATAFIFFEIAGTLATWIFRRGRVVAGRVLLAAVWFLGLVAVALVGYRQYGVGSVPPAAVAMGLSVAIVYAVARRGADRQSWLVAAAMASVAATAAAVALPLSLLLLLVSFGIDGP